MRYFFPVIVCLSAVVFSRSAQAAEWVDLFNGKDLTGWQAIDGPISSWQVKDGLLECSGAGSGWLSTDKEYADYELDVEFRVPTNGNSGVFLRAPHKGNPAYEGMEIQVLDDYGSEFAGKLQPYQYCGSLYGLQAAKPQVSKKEGEWQKLEIRCVGRKVTVKLNGTQIIDANLDDYNDQLKEHPGVGRAAGYVGLQNHSSPLSYRKVRIREVK